MQKGLLLGCRMHRQNRKEKPVVHHHVAAFRRYVNQLGLPWPKRWRKNFLDLGAALCVQRTLVVRRLARTLTGPQPTMRHRPEGTRQAIAPDSGKRAAG